MFSIAVGVLVFGAQLVAYGLIKNAVAKRRIYRQRLASIRSTEYAPYTGPIVCRNRLGED